LAIPVATWETVCEIISVLPGAALDSPDRDNPAWRVNGTVAVRRNPRLDDTVDPRGSEIIAIRTDVDERAALIEQDPDTFFLTEHWANSRHISVLVRLSTIETEQLRELILDAWRARATKRQLRDLGQQ
jgi:hypothetical protein